MRTKAIYAAVSAIGLVYFSAPFASSQTIDPTVEVSRDYEGKMIDVHKPVQTMPVPDSLQHFDLEFDYFVNDSPYKGAYVFTPYMLDMTPGETDFGERQLWLKAGAGFALQPVLDLVWSPLRKGRFRMNVYASHRSYFGRYRGIGLSPASDGGSSLVLDDYAWKPYYGPDRSAGSTSFSGYESRTTAGVDGIYAWKGGNFGFDVSYYGVAAKDTLLARGYDAVDAKFHIGSDNSASRRFIYGVSAKYRFGEDKADLSGNGSGYFQEHLMDMDVSLSPKISEFSRVDIDFGTDIAFYLSAGRYTGDIYAVPSYRFDKGRWDLDLGVKFAAVFFNDYVSESQNILQVKQGQFVFPAVNVAFEAVKDYLSVYVSADGGNENYTWSDMLDRNSRYDLYRASWQSLGNNLVNVAADIGIRGNVASRFGYDLRTGYVLSDWGLFDGIWTDAAGRVGYMPVYSASRLYHVTLSCKWESRDFSADGAFSYKDSDVAGRTAGAFAPAAFSGYVNMTYNWRKRIFVGVDCGFSAARKAVLASSDGMTASYVSLPGYADLGLSVEFKFSRQLSFWAHGGNLLDMTVQRIPLYAESGVNFTAGICLNL